MKKMLYILSVLFLFFTQASFAQSEGNVVVGGLASMSIPTQEKDNFSFKWARVNFTYLNDDYKAVFEYDLPTAAVKYAYAAKSFDLFGTTTIMAGQVLSPIGYLYHGPRTIPVPRWGITLDRYVLYLKGMEVQNDNSVFILKAAINDKFYYVALTENIFKTVSVYFQKSTGGGVIADFKVGKAQLKGGTSWHLSGINHYFVRAGYEIVDNLTLFSQFDKDGADSYFAGATYEYEPNSFVKIYYDNYQAPASREIEGENKDKVVVDITWSF
ncbi:MAG: hypothetical protein NUV82_00670 [Candidatus Komeilibacteria bacterium]|nr:hypothetical protein [Candidatus Komeilibacteria bacterium]